MAVDIFLKIEGIPGESRDDKHKGEIDILSWSWSMTQSGKMHEGGGGGSGKVSVGDMMFTKHTDKSTTALMAYCCNGKHIPSATLFVRKAGGDAQVEYLKIKMEEIIVTSYNNGGSKESNEQFIEGLSFNFSKYLTTYTEQTQQGTAGASSQQGWDMASNKMNS